MTITTKLQQATQKSENTLPGIRLTLFVVCHWTDKETKAHEGDGGEQ